MVCFFVMPKEETSSPAGGVVERVTALRGGEAYERITAEQGEQFIADVDARIHEALAELGKRVTEEQPGEALVRAHTLLTQGFDSERDAYLEDAIAAAAAEQGLNIDKRPVRFDLAAALYQRWGQVEFAYERACTGLLPPVMEQLLVADRTEAKAAAQLLAQYRGKFPREAEDWTKRIVGKLPDEDVSQLMQESDRPTEVLAALVESGRAELAMRLPMNGHDRASLFEQLKDGRHYRQAIRVLEDIDQDEAGYDTATMSRRLADLAIGDLVAAGYSVTVEYSRSGKKLFKITTKQSGPKEKQPTNVRYSRGAKKILKQQPRRSRDLAIAAIDERQEKLGVPN
jgi:hypothetical protein